MALFVGYENGGFEKVKHLFLVHGDLGVNFFFVLSGFLITFLLLSEKEKHGNISLPRFYLRRVLRIWPLYFMVLFIGFVVVHFVMTHSSFTFPFLTEAPASGLPWYLFFGANFRMAFYPLESIILAVGWSIAVEEQFYLIWPFVLHFFHRKNLPVIALCFILVSFVYRFVHYHNYNVVSYSTFAVMSDLAIGALVAHSTLFSSRMKSYFEHVSGGIIQSVYLLGFFLIILSTFLPALHPLLVYRIVYSLIPIIFSLFFAFVILEQNNARNSFIKFGDFKTLNYLGVRSYGLYCYHLIALFITLTVFYLFKAPVFYHSFVLYISEVALTFGLTILISIASYRLFEKKFLLLKDKYGHRRG